MLKIDNIHVTVDNKEVVKGVSLEIRPGEIHALMGPNGSGKSSLAMALMGHPRYGATKEEGRGKKEEGEKVIELDGEDITDKTPDERARMGLFLASQYPVGVGGVTVEQLLRRSVQELLKGPALSKQGRALSDTRIDVLKFRKDLEKLAEKIGVSKELLRRSINVGFSGGEKKKAEILQMSVLQPVLALLDETDSGLDIDALRIVAEGINALRSPERAILLVTHYARILEYVTPDHVHVMVGGKIVQSGGSALAHELEAGGYKQFL